MMPVVRIPDPIFQRLQTLAVPLVDTPATVVERLLNFYEAHNSTSSAIPAQRQSGQTPSAKRSPLRPDNPPDLDYTRVLGARFGGHTARNWNDLVRVALRSGLDQLKTFEALRSATLSTIAKGLTTRSGFQYVEGLNLSVQGVDANHAWRNSLHLAKKLSVPIRVEFEWRDRSAAARPGEREVLSWEPTPSTGTRSEA